MTIINDKSKCHFQPLLFDGFKYKSPDSTYQDHYKMRMKKQYNALNRRYNSATQKQKSAALSKGKPVNFVQQNINMYRTQPEKFLADDLKYYNSIRTTPKPPTPPQAPKIHQNILVIDDEQYVKKYVNFNPYVTVNEMPHSSLSRPSSNNYNVAYNVQLNINDSAQKLTSPPPASETDQLSILIKDNLKIENNIIENQIETSNLIVEKPCAPIISQQQQYHWSVYPQDKMPDYIVEAKKRLGQIKQPHIVPNSDKPPKNQKPPASPSAASVTNSEAHQKFMTTHWSQIPNPSTPDYIKAIRKRLGDDRYRKTNLKKSNSFSNFKTDESKAVTPPALASKSAEPKEEPEPYKIPSYLNINNNVQITTTSECDHDNYTNIMPSCDARSEIETAVDLVKSYDQKFKREEDRQINSRGSADSRASADSRLSSVSNKKPNPNMITFDTWLRNHATQKEKDSVMKVINQPSPAPSPAPSLYQVAASYAKGPYLSSASHNEFMTRPASPYTEYIRAQAKNPSPPGSNLVRKGTPTIRKLGVTRTSHRSSFSLDDEKNYIRDYLYNSPAIIKTGYGM